MPDHPFTNRLILEKSPYLLQHAHNPVNWYPWGEEAFAAAKAEDRPIFLSIGYATCHWCHVMEKECFENVEIAKLMNCAFINIKVDREELPEVDSLYMEFSQSMMAGSAGWPLNVILTPSLQPFFAATYLPPQTQKGMMGMRDLVARIQQVWTGEERERVMEQAGHIVEVFSAAVHVSGEQLPDREKVALAAELLFRMADPVYGGMKGAPKFPVGYQGDFLLSYAASHQDTRPLFLVERTLDMMHRGGIYDHIGGGFSRYSVDERWLVPHFEKMLYDNAILAHTYLVAWQATKRPLFAEVCREILDYVLRDMTQAKGGFYSAEDADSEGREGYFYTWTPAEISRVLAPDDARLIMEFYGVEPKGNFEERSILHSAMSLEEFAIKRGVDASLLKRQLQNLRRELWKAREERVHPVKDDKVLSAWNGLMIHTLAVAGCAFGERRYLDAALQSAHFIKTALWQKGRLFRRWREGDASFSGGIDEYAFVIRAALTLFEADCGVIWLQWAMEMAKVLQEEFKAKDGAFYQSDGKDPNLILRKMQFSDGAEPSGNAVHCENLLRLAQITRDDVWLRQAEDVFKAAKRFIDNYPPGYTYHMMNLLRYYDRNAPTLVVALNSREQWKEELTTMIYHHFMPHRTVIWRHHTKDDALEPLLYLSRFQPMEGQTTLYICKQGECLSPLHDLAEMSAAIAQL